MDKWSIDLLFLVVNVLLPLVPAAYLYRSKWGSKDGEVSGSILGISYKFAGAFAAYLIIFLFLVYVRPREGDHYHTWVVEGVIEAESGDPNLNDLFVRLVPPRLAVMNEGRFSWEIPVVEDSVGRLHFPNLQLDLAGYQGQTLSLDPLRRYGAAIVDMQHNEDQRLIIFLKPITLKPSRSGQRYVGVNVAPPAVNEAVVASKP